MKNAVALVAEPNWLENHLFLANVTMPIKQIEDARQKQLEDEPQRGSNARVLELQRISGLGIETADMLVRDVFSRDLRDRRAVARYAGLTEVARQI